MRHLAITGIETASWISRILSGSAMRATPPSARMSAGTRSSAITATAPASSAMRAWSASVTSMITPPLSISARPDLTLIVPVSAIAVILAVGLTGGRAGISRVTLEALFLTCHLPYPPVSGGRLREFELLRRISSAVDVHLCAVSKTYEADLAVASGLDDICASVTVLPAANANGSPPAQVLRHRCPDAARHVGSLLRNGEIDVLHVEGFYLMQHVPALTPAPVVLVEQNVEYSLWAQRLALAATPE